MLRSRGDTDKACAGSQGGLAGQADRAAHAMVTADHQQVTKIALVCDPLAWGEPRSGWCSKR